MPKPSTIAEEFFCLVAVEVLTPQQRRAHLELGSKKRKRFREAVMEHCRDRLHDGDFEIHHVIPLGLGGSDRIGNLVLCEHDYHTKIHKFINKQVYALSEPKGFIVIPRQSGMIWREPCRPDWKDESFEAYDKRYPYLGGKNVSNMPENS